MTAFTSKRRCAQSETEARKHLDEMVRAAVKMKSNSFESVGNDEVARSVMMHLSPWLFDPAKDITSHLYDRLRSTDSVTPMEYRNWFTIALMLEPSIGMGLLFYGTGPLSLDDIPVMAAWLS